MLVFLLIKLEDTLKLQSQPKFCRISIDFKQEEATFQALSTLMVSLFHFLLAHKKFMLQLGFVLSVQLGNSCRSVTCYMLFRVLLSGLRNIFWFLYRSINQLYHVDKNCAHTTPYKSLRANHIIQ